MNKEFLEKEKDLKEAHEQAREKIRFWVLKRNKAIKELNELYETIPEERGYSKDIIGDM